MTVNTSTHLQSKYHKQWKAVDTNSRRTSYPAQWMKHTSTTELYKSPVFWKYGCRLWYTLVRKGHTENKKQLLKVCLKKHSTVNFKDRATHKSGARSNNRTSAYVQIVTRNYIETKLRLTQNILVYTYINPSTYYWQCKATMAGLSSEQWIKSILWEFTGFRTPTVDLSYGGLLILQPCGLLPTPLDCLPVRRTV